jgi:hypothetical protein
VPTIRTRVPLRSIARSTARRLAEVQQASYFAGHLLVEEDPDNALRVSRYLGDAEESRHVGFSVWSGGGGTPRAEAAVSLADGEAERLARFLGETARITEQPTAG